MKYLNKFNESNNEFFEEIKREEFYELSSKSIRFTNSEKESITNCVPVTFLKNGILSTNPNGEYFGIKEPHIKSFFRNILTYFNSYIEISMSGFKLPDEWFVVKLTLDNNFTYYKCDQLDGLIVFLNSIKEILKDKK